MEQCLQHVSQQNKIYPALRLFQLSATPVTYQDLLQSIIEYVHSETNLGYQIKAKRNQTPEILTPEAVFRAIFNGQQLQVEKCKQKEQMYPHLTRMCLPVNEYPVFTDTAQE